MLNLVIHSISPITMFQIRHGVCYAAVLVFYGVKYRQDFIYLHTYIDMNT